MEHPTPSTTSTPLRTPPWWTEGHTSSWDRVKDAFRRDWEQTKTDFASASGPNLNQNAGDTVLQAIGAAPMPLEGLKTRPSDPKSAAREANEARVQMVAAAQKADERMVTAQVAIVDDRTKLDDTLAAVRRDLAKDQLKASERIAAATRSASDDIQKQNQRVTEAAAERDVAAAKWRQAEQEARYGYALRTQRPNDVWDDVLESSLRTEWTTLGTDWSWEASRSGVRRGWDYASRAR